MSDFILINDDLRTMQIPDSIKILGDDVNKIVFKMPKEYKGFDLSTFQPRINYMNAAGYGDLYIAEDLSIDDEDPSLMSFTWLVGRTACAYKGQTRFVVCLKLFDGTDDAEVIKEFNTTVYSLPVLEGLETLDAVVQKNPDIIEYILQRLQDAGVIDPNDYYTKDEIDEMLPRTTQSKTVEGQIVHVVDAVPQAVEDFKAYDASNNVLPVVDLSIANKNLFRIDLIGDLVISKGVTFDRKSDGSIQCSGTSTGTDAKSSCNIHKNVFAVGNTYTLSTSKVTGFAAVMLSFTYADNTTEDVVALNASKTFTISKAVSSCVGSIVVQDTGCTVDGEVVYPQLEIGSTATTFAKNVHNVMVFDGSVMPVLPASISNVWSRTDAVKKLEMEYEADIVLEKIDEYANDNLKGTTVNGVLVATYNGLGTVALGIG